MLEENDGADVKQAVEDEALRGAPMTPSSDPCPYCAQRELIAVLQEKAKLQDEHIALLKQRLGE